MEKTTYQKNQKYVGQTVLVLVDSLVKGGWLSGNSEEMKMVRFKGTRELIGKIVKVKIYKAEEWILLGRML